MVLVGPSGCGKTTALRMVAGLEAVTKGRILFEDRVMNDVAPRKRDVAMVFQNYALYPHMSVADNIGYALKVHGVPRAEVRRRVHEAAEILGLTDWLDRKPTRLSGGQRQRVAMGRAIVREPAVFLMDEPLSNLDAKLRAQMRAEVLRIQRRVGVATIYVTHDQTEAMTLGDRVAVLRDGVLQQCDTPQVLYNRPINLFVAAFIGSPPMNLFEGTLAADGGSLLLGSQRLALPGDAAARPGALLDYSGRKVIVGMRPESFSAASDGAANAFQADVDLVESLGSDLLVHFQIDAPRLRIERVVEDESERVLAQGTLAGGSEGIARLDPDLDVRAGRRISLAVDAHRLHYFDPETGLALG
jgi:multiple sugar transport system ATP-binding protein